MAEHDQPNSATIAQLQDQLITELKQRKALTVPTVEMAFRAIPRHLFLPDVPIEQAYQNQAIPTKHQDDQAISSSSQPSIMAVMLEQLALAPGQRVLEIGAGTGYNAALMAHLVGSQGEITSMDIDDDIVANARQHLDRAGYEHVRVICGDGARGYPDAAPYDRIILTVGTWDILPAWIEQLQLQGRLVVPLTIVPGVMLAVAFEQRESVWKSVHVAVCGFMPLRGAFAHPELGGPSIAVYPKAQQAATTSYTMTIDKDWSQVVVTWPTQHRIIKE